MLKPSFADHSKSYQQAVALLVVVIVAALGTYSLVTSRAATPYASVNASSGSIANGAQAVQSCSGSSSGSCVVFKQPISMDGNVALALTSPGTPFAASSFWNTPLPASTPVNVNNSAYLNAIAYNLCFDATAVPETPPPACPTSTYYGALNSSAWSAPLYVVPANQPYVPVADICGHASNSYYVTTVLTPGVPVPADAHAATGTDEEIEIYQPSTDKYWDFWRFQKDSSGNWGACWGGVISGISQSNGIFPNNTGATATSLPLIGADPRIEEFQAGQINHAIGLTIGDVGSADLARNIIPANTPGATSGVSWPATRTDGSSTDSLAIPEGLRFRLNPSLDVNSLGLTPVARVIAIAAQKYGFVVNDSCGQPCMAIRVGDPTTYTTAGLPNPYTSGPGVGGVGTTGLYAGVPGNQIMKNFPWNQLQALPFSYGGP